MPAVTLRMNARLRPAQKLGHQDVRQRFQDCRGRAFQHVGDAEIEARVVPPDRTIRIRELAELHANGWKGRTGLQLAENAREDLLGRLKENRALQHCSQNNLLTASLFSKQA